MSQGIGDDSTRPPDAPSAGEPGCKEASAELTADTEGDEGSPLASLLNEIPDLEPSLESGPGPEATPSSDALEIEQLRRKLADRESQLARVADAYRRLRNEIQAIEKRFEKSHRRRLQKSKTDFIARFVEVLDNLDRAIDSIENNFDPDSVLQGILLLRSRLVQLLREEGLEKVFVGGQPFDPTHSEAAAVEPVDNESEDNVVIRELQRGYMMKGSLLRPARVVVGRYHGPRGPGTSPSSDSDPEDSSS